MFSRAKLIFGQRLRCLKYGSLDRRVDILSYSHKNGNECTEKFEDTLYGWLGIYCWQPRLELNAISSSGTLYSPHWALMCLLFCFSGEEMSHLCFWGENEVRCTLGNARGPVTFLSLKSWTDTTIMKFYNLAEAFTILTSESPTRHFVLPQNRYDVWLLCIKLQNGLIVSPSSLLDFEKEYNHHSWPGFNQTTHLPF